MGVKHGLRPNCDMFTNNAIRPYLDRRVYRCSGINNRRWVNRHEKSLYQPTIQEELNTSKITKYIDLAETIGKANYKQQVKIKTTL